MLCTGVPPGILFDWALPTIDPPEVADGRSGKARRPKADTGAQVSRCSALMRPAPWCLPVPIIICVGHSTCSNCPL